MWGQTRLDLTCVTWSDLISIFMHNFPPELPQQPVLKKGRFRKLQQKKDRKMIRGRMLSIPEVGHCWKTAWSSLLKWQKTQSVTAAEGLSTQSYRPVSRNLQNQEVLHNKIMFNAQSSSCTSSIVWRNEAGLKKTEKLFIQDLYIKEELLNY